MRITSGLSSFLAVSLLAACDAIDGNQIPKSDALAASVIAEIKRWSMSGDPVLVVATMRGLSSYETVCIVREYDKIRSVEELVLGRKLKFTRELPLTVPESHAALLIIKENEAVVGFTRNKEVFVTAPHTKSCQSVQIATFTRRQEENFFTPIAELGDKNDND